MSTPLPPVTLYEQFYVVGIIVLVLCVLAVAARLMLRDLVKWQDDQDVKREQERELQRKWMEQQEAKAEADRATREKSWQDFFQRINGDNRAAIYNLVEIHTKLVERIDAMTRTLEAHDNFVHDRLEQFDEKPAGSNNSSTRRRVK